MERILVLGLGNPLRRDDGIGPRVVAELARGGLPRGVAVIDAGAAGLELLDLLAGADRAVIVDAAEVQREPGCYARFTLDVAELAGAGDSRSLHQVGLAEVVSLARALQQPLPEMVIFGVQPADLEWGEGLSQPVAAVLPRLVHAVREEIGKERIMPAKILIIEDSPDMALAVQLPLEAEGYTVATAASGAEGLELVKQFAPDLIVLDVMMETSTAGFQVSLQLRSPDPGSEYAAFRNVPILMLTAIHTTTSLRFAPDEAYLPVDDFVEKPIDPDVLLEKVRSLLAQ